MNFERIKGSTWCMMLSQLIPVYRIDERRCILIDTGFYKMHEDIDAVLSREGLVPEGIIISHIHPDHTGSTAYLREKYGARVAMPEAEASLAVCPLTYKVAVPAMSTRSDYENAGEGRMFCHADELIPFGAESFTFCGVSFSLIDLPGHSPAQLGIITPDGVCYGADALLSGMDLKMPYAADIGAYRASMEKLRHINCEKLILSHRGVFDAPFDELIDRNLRANDAILQEICSIIDRPMPEHEVYLKVVEKLGLHIKYTFKAVGVMGILRRYLDHLVETGRISLVLEGELLNYAPGGKEI